MATTEDTTPEVGSAPGSGSIERPSTEPRQAVGSAGRKLIEHVAEEPEQGKPKEIDVADQEDALEWLLGAFREKEEWAEDELLINVGTPQHQKKIKWVIRSVEGPVIRQIRDQAANARVARRGGATGMLASAEQVFQANVRVVVAGTVSPDIKAGAAEAGVPADVFLEMALNRKQGLIDQLAAEIMSLSGFDDDDLQDATATRAAGNS